MSDIQQCQLCGADLVAGGSDINAELAKRDADIERLRGLLREAEKMWPNPGLSSESANWYRRVREALGE